MSPRFVIAALAVVLSAGSAEAQPVLPPRGDDDPGEALDRATPELDTDPPDTTPEVPLEDALDDAGEIEADLPEVRLPAAKDDPETAQQVEPPEEELSPERLERRRRSHQAAIESAEPRSALPDLDAIEPPPWRRRLEIGGHFAFVVRPLADAKGRSEIGYKPAPGWGIHIHWSIVDWLRFSPYFLDSHHALDIPPGGMAVERSTKSISATAGVETGAVATFSFGVKLQPTWNITERLRAWGTVGVGWGRFEFPTMTITEGDLTFEARDRSAVFVEFPLGLGVSFDLIERWLAIEYEATAAPITGQSGNAHEIFQVVDADGSIRDVGPFGAIELSVAQTLGLSLLF